MIHPTPPSPIAAGQHADRDRTVAMLQRLELPIALAMWWNGKLSARPIDMCEFDLPRDLVAAVFGEIMTCAGQCADHYRRITVRVYHCSALSSSRQRRELFVL